MIVTKITSVPAQLAQSISYIGFRLLMILEILQLSLFSLCILVKLDVWEKRICILFDLMFFESFYHLVHVM